MEEIYTIALQLVPKVGRKTIQKLYLDNLDVEKDELFYKRILNSVINKYDKENKIDFYLEKAKDIINKSTLEAINIISIFNKDFPNIFKSIEDFPVIIHYKGNKNLLYNDNNLAIIGTRKITDHGLKATARLTELAVKEGFTIVSGLALGCDAQAHKTALDNEGFTIAVMPGGLDSIYPKSNTLLGNAILKNNGCLVSEYNVYTKPFPGYYVERDRLQTALSKGILVVETSIKGGSMHAINNGIRTNRIIGAYNNPNYYRNKRAVQIEGNLDLIKKQLAISLENTDNVNLFFEKSKNLKIKIMEDWSIQLKI